MMRIGATPMEKQMGILCRVSDRKPHRGNSSTLQKARWEENPYQIDRTFLMNYILTGLRMIPKKP